MPSYPTLKVEVALGVGSGGFLVLDDPILGVLDAGTLGPDIVWNDITEYVRGSRSQSSRRDRSLNAYQAGDLAIDLIDKDARFDPTNLSGPYVVGGLSVLTAGRPVRVTATWAGTTYPMWSGYVKAWAAADRDGMGGDQWCTLTAVDAFTLLARNNPVAQAAVGAGELSGARITRILDNARWSPDLRSVAAGNSTLQATTLATNTLTELQLTAASEQGTLFVDREGQVTFVDRYAAVTATRSTVSQATFADFAADPATSTPLTSAPIRTDDETLINRVQLGRAGGSVQIVEDPTSIAVHSADVPRSWGRTDLLLQTDAEVLDAAGWILSQFKTPESRFTEVTVRGATNPTAMWPVLLDLRQRDRITVKRKRRGADIFAQDVFVEGMRHTITVDGSGRLDWVTAYTVTPTTGYGGFLVLDDATLGKLDTGLLAF